jgi:hypothetical protein
MRPNAALLIATVLLLAAADPSEAVRRRAFVTSVTGTGNLASWPDAGGLGALAAGDAICRARASAGGMPNAGTYRAWLSTATTDAYCHVQGLTGERSNDCNGGSPANAGPWFRDDGFGILPATEGLDALVDDGVIYRPMLYDEFQQPIHDDPPVRYWTGTRSDGTGDAANCTSWVVGASGVHGVRGDATTTAQVWSWGSSAPCDQASRLLCLEPGLSEPTGQKWATPAALVFLTSATGTGDFATWPQAGGAVGLAAGDAICRNLAEAAHLPAPESFIAWLSAGAVDAADRLTSTGPFRRIDGVLVASSRADLLDLSNTGSIHQYEDGSYHQGGGGGHAWTGTDGFGSANGEDCSAWTSAASDDQGRPGVASSTLDASWTERGSLFDCNFTSPRLYCFSNVVTLFWDGFESGDAARWSTVAP